MLLCQPVLSLSPGLPLPHSPPPSPVCRLGGEGLRRPQNLRVLWVGDLLCPSCLQRDFAPLVRARSTSTSRGLERNPGAGGHGGFWPLLLGTGAPASLGCCLPVLPSATAPWGGGLGLSPLSLQQWLVGWDDAPCGVTCAVSWSGQLGPRSPEIHGCSHMAAGQVHFRKCSRWGAAGTGGKRGLSSEGVQAPHPTASPGWQLLPAPGSQELAAWQPRIGGRWLCWCRAAV